MATKVLDSHALMAFFQDEPGADFVRGLIHKAMETDTNLLMSIVNLGEVWYAIARTNSPEIADQYINEIEGMGIEIVGRARRSAGLACRARRHAAVRLPKAEGFMDRRHRFLGRVHRLFRGNCHNAPPHNDLHKLGDAGRPMVCAARLARRPPPQERPAR